jgi:hypothetical protein
MTLRASPSRACPRVSRSRSLAGVRPGLAGRSAAPPACTEGSPPPPLRAPIAPRVPLLADARHRALGLLDGRLLDERLRLSVQVLRLGRRGAGIARSSVAATMSFWLARGGVSGLSTLKSALMRSRTCMPSSRTRSPRAEAFPTIEARSNRTVRYSSASLASSSRAWASCALMSAPVGGEGAGALGPAARREAVPRAGVTSPSPAPAAPVAFAGSLAMQRSTPARGRSSWCWSRRSNRTSSPWRREIA